MCYDGTNCKVAKEERCFGKTIRGNRKSIVKLSTKAKVGATSKAC